MRKELIAVMICLPLFSSCDALDGWAYNSMSAEEQAYFDSYSASAEVQDRKIRDLEGRIRVTLSELRESRNVDELQDGVAGIRALQEEHENAVAAYEDVSSRANSVLSDSLSKTGGGFLAFLDPLVPVPLQPLVPVLSSLAVMVMSRRGRKHAAKGIRHATTGNLGRLISSVLAAVGARHSNSDAAGVLAGAAVAARSQIADGELPPSALDAIEEARTKVAASE